MGDFTASPAASAFALLARRLIHPIAVDMERRLTVDQVSRVFAAYPSLSSNIPDPSRAMNLVNIS